MTQFGLEANVDKEPEDNFYDEEKLSTDYIPEEMPHREEYQEMFFRNIFQCFNQGRSAKNNYVIYGKPGTGKTMIVKSLIDQIEENSPQKALDKFEVVYINCSSASSYSGVFSSIAEHFGYEWKSGIKKDKNKRELLVKMQDIEKEVLVVLDEMDELKKKNGSDHINDVLYTLTRPHEEAPVKQKKYDFHFNFICISNDPNIHGYLEDWNSSETDSSTQPIEMMGYKRDEITDILMARQQEAFDEELLDREALDIIADDIFRLFDSDIRKALGILRKIPDKIDEKNIVKQDGFNQGEVAREAINSFKETYMEKVLQNGDKHFLILMSSFYVQMAQAQEGGEDEIKTKRIQEAYWDGCEKCGIDKRGESFISRELEELTEDYNLTDRRRDYSEGGNPYKYKANFDIEVFRKKVKERMERYGLWEQFRDEDTAAEAEAREEAQQKMEEMGVL